MSKFGKFFSNVFFSAVMITVVVTLINGIFHKPDHGSASYPDNYEEEYVSIDTSVADAELSLLLQSTEYTAADAATQHDMAQRTLTALYEDGALATEPQYHETSDMYTFEYAGGALGGFSFREPDAAYNTQSEDITCTRASTVTGEEAVAVIYNGFGDSRAEYYNTLAQEWTSKGVPTYVDHAVTVDDLKSIADTNVIVFSMHGSMYGDVPTILPNEAPNQVRDSYYSQDLTVNKSIAKVTYPSGNCYYEVLPWFFNYHYIDNQFDGCVFFSETCEFFGNHGITQGKVDYFSEALDSLSAEAVMGFYNIVDAYYSRNMMEYTLESILFDAQTPYTAAAAAREKYGDNDGQEVPEKDKYPAYLHVDGSGVNTVLFGKNTDTAAPSTPAPAPSTPTTPSASTYPNAHAAYKALLEGSDWPAYTVSNAEDMDYATYANDCFGYWLLWDLDKDGTQELVISSGWAQANFCLTAFTYSNGELRCLGSQYCGSGFAEGDPAQSGIVIKSYHGGGAVHYRLDIVQGTLRITQQRDYDESDMDFVHHITAGGNWSELETHSLDDTSDLS